MHTDNLIVKISQGLGVLRRIKQYLDLNTRTLCFIHVVITAASFDLPENIAK